jgi:hypothetical protein
MLGKVMADFKYGNIDGYHPKRLSSKDLAKWRTGLSAANPAGAMLMVQEIDRLRKELADTKQQIKSMSPPAY